MAQIVGMSVPEMRFLAGILDQARDAFALEGADAEMLATIRENLHVD